MSTDWPAERLQAAAHALLQALASGPRAAGSSAEASARAACAEWLRREQYDVVEEPFDYSTIPGRWGTSGAGVLAILLLLLAGAAGSAGRPSIALSILAAGAVLLGAAARWLARTGVLQLRAGRTRSVNLVARRAAEPGVWLVAHLDSKSQPVPILVRSGGIVLVALAWLCGLALAAAQASGARTGWTDAWWWIAGAGTLAALTVAASVVGDDSSGAVDNASGVATVLLAAAMLPLQARIGVLITSAEELGLAGARAWVATSASMGRRRVPVLNVDGVDDGGTVTVMHGSRPPRRIREALVRAAREQRVRIRGRRLLPGILADSVAFSDAEWDAVTISRGNVGTVARIHLSADNLSALSGAGVAIVAPLVASAAATLSTEATS